VVRFTREAQIERPSASDEVVSRNLVEVMSLAASWKAMVQHEGWL